MEMTGKEIEKATGGTLIQGDPDTKVSGITIDSREITPGDWFVPLEGENTDGHNYIHDALSRGAAGSFISWEIDPGEHRDALLVKVKDPLKALQELSRYHRRKHSVKVVGVTGSSGKTTTKDLIASVLAQNFRVLKTEGNLNNEIGLPLMLLQLKKEHQVAVLEMGMSSRGEIELLTRLAAPQWGVITNIGEAHLEILGSKEEIALAKGELLENMEPEGTALLNGDDPFLSEAGKRFKGKTYYFGKGEHNDFRFMNYSVSRGGSSFRVKFPGMKETRLFQIPLHGKHHAGNALSALALGYLLGIEPEAMQRGLNVGEFTWGRMELKESSIPGVKIIDDSYNANPDSVKASLEVMQELGVPGKTVLVLGDMLELGSVSEEKHREIGRMVARQGAAKLVTVGNWSRYTSEEASHGGVASYHFEDADSALKYLEELQLEEGAWVLVKGSRGIKLDEIVRKMTL